MGCQLSLSCWPPRSLQGGKMSQHMDRLQSAYTKGCGAAWCAGA